MVLLISTASAPISIARAISPIMSPVCTGPPLDIDDSAKAPPTAPHRSRAELGIALAQQELVKVLEPPFAFPDYKVKQHWHERFNLDTTHI